jgi:hypothetical protein
MGGCEDRIWVCEAEESSLLEAVASEQLVKTHQSGKGWVCEAEGSPLLEAVASEWLVKTHQSGKGLVAL